MISGMCCIQSSQSAWQLTSGTDISLLLGGQSHRSTLWSPDGLALGFLSRLTPAIALSVLFTGLLLCFELELIAFSSGRRGLAGEDGDGVALTRLGDLAGRIGSKREDDGVGWGVDREYEDCPGVAMFSCSQGLNRDNIASL